MTTDNSRTDALKDELETEAGDTTEETEETTGEEDTEEEETDEGTEAEGDEDEEEEADDSEDDDGDDDAQDEAAQKALKKFEGKSREEVIDMYRNLEKRLGKRPISNVERAKLKELGITGKDIQSMRDAKDDLDDEIAKLDFTSMSPQDFAKWIVGVVDRKASARAQEIYQTSTQVQNAVRTEIQEAVVKYPALKQNVEYRDLVIAIVESGAARGEVVPLLDACKKVEALIGGKKKADETDKKKLRRARAAVEQTERTITAPDTEAERIRKGVLSAGSSTGGLGGLGV